MVSDFVVGFLLPFVSLLLGFWVAFRRPRDPLAWLLLALMLSFPHILQTFVVYGWPPGWREAGRALREHPLGGFPHHHLSCLAASFPSPSPREVDYDKVWRALQWLCALPFAILAGLGVIVNVGGLSDYRSVAGLHRMLAPLTPVSQVLSFALIGSFFAAMGIKLGLSQSPDAKRRLRFLYWGAIAAFTPSIVVSLYARLQGKSPNEIFPAWLIAIVLIPLDPLSAHAELRHRGAESDGRRRRLAPGSAIHACQGRYTHTADDRHWGLSSLPERRWRAIANHDRAQKIIVILVGITAYFTIRRLGDGLRTWVDRRFFRENYNAEHVLTELSEQVRSIVEPRSLLETVAGRISETLHVPQVAVLLSGGGFYQPAFAMGYASLPTVAFPSKTGTAMLLKSQKEPARVFLNDRDSWVYREQTIGDEERRKLATLQSELLLPLAVRDKLLGFISLGPKRSEEPYTGSDVRLLKSVAAQTGLALENANLLQTVAEEVAQRERLNREVEIAREVQERLFPQKLPDIEGVEFCGAFAVPPSAWAGTTTISSRFPVVNWGSPSAMSPGKGIAAALMMASLQASLRGEATRAPDNLAALIANVNRLVYEASSSNRYATFFYSQYNPSVPGY